jgi:hypothetical protein
LKGQALYRVKDGRRTKLSEKSDPDYVSKFLSRDKAGKRRITVNRYEKIIQVFVDGGKQMEVEDESFSCGRAGFFSDKSAGFMIDDIEIASITRKEKALKNEKIEWFVNRERRVLNSVLDSFGATGGFHPGDYRGKGREKWLAELQSGLFGGAADSSGKKSDTADVLDFQWLSLDGAFRERWGMSKEQGFITGQCFKKSRGSYLWAPCVLFGNWKFSCLALGDAEKFEAALIENMPYIKTTRKYEFALYEKGKTSAAEGNGLDAEKWRFYELVKKDSEIFSYIDGKEIENVSGIQKDILLRPGIFAGGGTVFIDSASAIVKPDLFYDFGYNMPYSLCLSDWETKNVSEESHGGGYYCFLVLKGTEKKTAQIVSRRSFTGDVSLMLTLDLEDFKKLDIGFVPDGGGAADAGFFFTKDKLSIYSGVKTCGQEVLSNFSAEKRRMSEIFVNIKKGTATVCLSDDEGTMRPIYCGKMNFDFSRPFRIRVGGAPDLRIARVMLWGKEQ